VVDILYRVSLVWMFYSTPPSEATPRPFAELRVFFFKDKELTRNELRLVRRGLRAILDGLLDVFHTLAYARGIGKADYDEELSLDDIRGKIVTEIHGFEVEEVDIDEVSKWFLERHKTLLLDEPYRYARFYRRDGTIKKEYDEWDIRGLERLLGVERYAELAKDVVVVFERIVESTRLYERLIKELMGGV
jgi:hypothetical protein